MRYMQIAAFVIVWLLVLLMCALASDYPISDGPLVATIAAASLLGAVLMAGVIAAWQGRLQGGN